MVTLAESGTAMDVMGVMRRWPTQEAAISHLEQVRWGGRPICPYCSSTKACVHASKDKKLPRWQCQDCHRAFSATVGTIFHHTHLSLPTWFVALAIMLNAKKGVSNAQLARDLGLPYKTAWSLALRIREAMLSDPAQSRLFHGIVETDETYVGGNPRESNIGSAGQDSGKKSTRDRATSKMAVIGYFEPQGRNFAPRVAKQSLHDADLAAFFRRIVDGAAAITITYGYPGYLGFEPFTEYHAISHNAAPAVGDTQSDTIEGLRALLERSWFGRHYFYFGKWASRRIFEAASRYDDLRNAAVSNGLVRGMVGVAA